jgi:hypothetical protein
VTQPKRLITLNARTDAIAERVKRQTKYGFSSWVRARLIAWDDRQKYGYEESRDVERLRLERSIARRRRVAYRLAEELSFGRRSWVDMSPDQICAHFLQVVKDAETSSDVVE